MISKESADGAILAATTAKEAAENAGKNREEINELTDAMARITETSKEIENIIASIEDIASQTNLLSLNASIEAARAGEAGRGFAVVATEIGNLATTSAEVATQIQNVSKQVIGAVNELAKEAEKMLTFMEETAIQGYAKLLDTSENYRSDVDDTNHIMQEFATASNRLKENIEFIKNAAEAVNIAVEESAEGIVNVTQSTVELTTSVRGIGSEAESNKSIAVELGNEVNKFKLE